MQNVERNVVLKRDPVGLCVSEWWDYVGWDSEVMRL